MLPTAKFANQPVPALLRASVSHHPTKTFIRRVDPEAPERTPEAMSFAEFERGVRRAAAILKGAGVEAGDRVLILAENSPQWQMISLAAQALRAEVASLFANLSDAQVCDIARRVDPKVAFVSTAEQFEKLRPSLDSLETLRLIVSAEDVEVPDSLRVQGLAEVLEGEPIPADEWAELVDQVTLDDPFTMLFTSGTTGRQKGVRLSQRCFVNGLYAGQAGSGMAPDDVGLLFLPFGHVAGQCQFNLAIAVGHSLIMVSQKEHIPRGFELSPTHTLSVPLIYERVWQSVVDQVANKPKPLARLLTAGLAAAARVASGSTSLGDRVLAAVARRLIGSKLHAKLGGRVRFLVAGGASSSSDMVAFFEGLGIPYVNFYGMSETAGIIAVRRRGDRQAHPECVGKPWRDLEVHVEPDGEICVRGETLMTGYLEAEDGADAYTDDGYFRTGDVGRLDGGYLYVTGRKKAIFVLSTGKNVSPEPIELALSMAPGVAGAVLLGDDRPYIAAALFVESDEIKALERAGQGRPEDILLERARARLDGFAEYEKPKRAFIIPGTPQDYLEVLTPTLKVKRHTFADRFAEPISDLYAEPKRAERPAHKASSGKAARP